MPQVDDVVRRKFVKFPQSSVPCTVPGVSGFRYNSFVHVVEWNVLDLDGRRYCVLVRIQGFKSIFKNKPSFKPPGHTGTMNLTSTPLLINKVSAYSVINWGLN